MNVLIPLAIACALFFLASKLYGGYVYRNLGVDPARETPACSLNDGRDYVPTKLHILFAHHFSAIAGAGPIIGPVLAIIYGVVPALLWVIFGGILIGGVHDFTTLFVSVQERGMSVAEVCRKTLGKPAYILFILFTILMIVLVTSSFLTAASTSLTSKWPLDKLGLLPAQNILRTTLQNGVVMGNIGGIASASVIVITLFSPILGYFIYRRRMRVSAAYIMAGVICIGSIIIGVIFPVSVSADTWKIVLSFYVLLAAGLPVWLILQPRDFINVQILYAGIFALLASLFIGGLHGLAIALPQQVAASSAAPAQSIPPFNIKEGSQYIGMIWPMLFITVACGAISGFHGMVASGTTAKQVSSESHIKTIGYNGMLLESILAVCVILALGSTLVFVDYKNIVWPDFAKASSGGPILGARSNPILAFSLSIGQLIKNAFNIPVAYGAIFGILLVEGFVITTLDAAVRLNRYLFEELWNILFKSPPAFTKWYWFNSALSVILMWLFSRNPFTDNWKLFGTGNQMLAALSFLALSVWLITKKKKFIFALIPAIFMIITTIASCVLLFGVFGRIKNFILLGADIALLSLAVALVVIAFRAYNALSRAAKLP